MKKILILIPWFHPAYKAGGPVRSIHHMLRAFEEEQGLEFYVFCSNQDLDGSVLQVKTDAWTDYTRNSKVWYCSAHVGNHLKQQIENIKPTAFFVVGIFDPAYNFKPLLRWKHIPAIISVRGMLHPGALSQKRLKKTIYLALWKLLGIHKRNVFHATTAEEKAFIENYFGKNTVVQVAANLPADIPFQQPGEKLTGQLVLCTIALISPMKNHELVLQALLETDNKYRVEYHIYGPVKDKLYWNRCEALIQQMPANVQVVYHGDIAPDEVVPALAQTHVVVQPSKSENYGHALYEALLAGRPLITSKDTPWNGLAERLAGKNIDAGNREELKNAIAFYAACSDEEYQLYCRAARDYAIKAVGRELIKAQYRGLFGIGK